MEPHFSGPKSLLSRHQCGQGAGAVAPHDADPGSNERAERAEGAAAEALFRQALALDPREHHAAIGLAEILVESGRASEAIPLIEIAISRRRTRGAYRVLLGDARRAAGDAAGAEAAYREALEVEPDNRAARSRLGM